MSKASSRWAVGPETTRRAVRARHSGRASAAGFTLIEILIAIAIVGVLAAIALPSYQAALVRARVSEGLSLATVAEKVVAENAMERVGDLAEGYTPPGRDRNVERIEVAPVDGLITITYTDRAGGGTVELRPTQASGAALEAGKNLQGEVHWSCTGGTLAAKYRPASCRP